MQDGVKALRRIAFVFAGLGLILGLFAAGAFYSTYSFSHKAVRTPGKVVDFTARRTSSGTMSYYPIIRFQAGSGQQITFEDSTGSRPAAYEVGATVSVFYDPRDPQKARIERFLSLWLLPTLLAGFGAIILGVAALLFWLPVRTRRRVEWLRANGMKIVADVRSIEVNHSVTVGGQHPYCIHCTVPDPLAATVREFISEDFYFDPKPFVQEKVLDVWFDPKRPRRYWVDVEAIRRRHGSMTERDQLAVH